MGMLLLLSACDSLCTTESTFSAELSTMLLRLASVGPLRSIMDNVGNGIGRGLARRPRSCLSNVFELIKSLRH